MVILTRGQEFVPAADILTAKCNILDMRRKKRKQSGNVETESPEDSSDGDVSMSALDRLDIEDQLVLFSFFLVTFI